jgi:hypothetical protein
MKKTRETKKAPSAESIARMADRGEDVSHFFTNRGKMMHPLPLANVPSPTRSRSPGNAVPRNRGIR